MCLLDRYSTVIHSGNPVRNQIRISSAWVRPLQPGMISARGVFEMESCSLFGLVRWLRTLLSPLYTNLVSRMFYPDIIVSPLP